MLKSPLKLIFIIGFLQINAAFAQVNAISNHYNNWLKSAGLDALLQTEQIKEQPNRAIHLILKPADSYKDPVTFARDWGYVTDGFAARGINIDSVLLHKLAFYSFLPPGSVSLEVLTSHPDIYSLKIKYNKKLIVTGDTISFKGQTNPIDFNFDAAFEILRRNYWFPANYTNINAVYEKLKKHFQGYHHIPNDQIQVDSFTTEGNNGMTIRVSHIFHHIIRNYNYHELILFDFELKNNEVHYAVELEYAPGGGKTPDPVKEQKVYADLHESFGDDWKYYIGNLSTELGAAVKEK